MPKYSNPRGLAVPTIGISNSLFFNIASGSSIVSRILLILIYLLEIGGVFFLGYYYIGLAFRGL